MKLIIYSWNAAIVVMRPFHLGINLEGATANLGGRQYTRLSLA